MHEAVKPSATEAHEWCPKDRFCEILRCRRQAVKVGEEHDIVPIGPKFDSHPPPERPPCMSDRQEEEVSAMRHTTFVRVAMCNERVYMVE